MLAPLSFPIHELIVDPIAEQNVELHGPFAALAQGSDWRKKLERLDAAVLHAPQMEMPVNHWFARGVYARELFIPKGTVLTGRIHKYSQINILVKGDISVLTEEGIVRIKAPCVIESPPGTKRAGYAHEDTVWMTVSGTSAIDPDEIEELLTCRTYAEYEAFCATQGTLPWPTSLVEQQGQQLLAG